MKDVLIVEFQEVFDTILAMRVVHQDDSKIDMCVKIMTM